MRGQILEGIGGVIAFVMTSDVIDIMIRIVALILEHWLTISVVLWALTSGMLALATPMSLLDSFGFTLYIFYAFFVFPIPIPVRLFGIVIGADAITMVLLLMFNVFKMGLAAIFHLALAFSAFFYSWHIVKMTLDVLNTLK